MLPKMPTPHSNQVEKVQNIEVHICGPLDDIVPQGLAGEVSP